MYSQKALYYSDKYIEEQNSPEVIRRYLFYAAKQRAKKRNIDFSLKQEDIIVPESCPIFGFKLERRIRGTGGPQPSSPTLDRINPEVGYTPSNIRVISHRANACKNNMTRDQLKKIIDYIDGKI